MATAPVVLLLAASAGAAGDGKWVKTNKELLLKDKKGSISEKFVIGRSEKNLEYHPEQKFTDKVFVSTDGGVSSDGRFAWILRDEARWLVSGDKATISLKYFDQSGEMLWEKNTAMKVNLNRSGDAVAVLEGELKWIAVNEHRNGPGYPKVYSSSGELLLDFGDCRANEPPFFSGNGRYGAVLCDSVGSQTRAILFDLTKKIKKEISHPARVGVGTRDDGAYVLITSYQKYDSVTKKYGEFVTEEIAHGRIE
jgi:hypothetical protein